MYNQVVTTVIDGQTETKTVKTTSTLTETKPAATITETAPGKDHTVSDVKTITSTTVISHGGSATTSTMTSVQTLPGGSRSEPPAGPSAPAGGSPPPAGSSGTAEPTSTEPSTSDEWDEGGWGEATETASQSASPSASSDGDSGGWGDLGAAIGRPKASVAAALATASLAMLAGAIILLA